MMNRIPHEIESKIQTPLLLKYKERSDGMEIDIDANTGDHIGKWTKYREPKFEIWRLQLSGNNGFIADPYDGEIHCFRRTEYYTTGNENPIVIHFTMIGNSPSNETFQLPDEYYTHHEFCFNKILDTGIQRLLQDYERCKSEWKTPIVVEIQTNPTIGVEILEDE